MDPARMFKESLTSCPELENSQGRKATLADDWTSQLCLQERTSTTADAIRLSADGGHRLNLKASYVFAL